MKLDERFVINSDKLDGHDASDFLPIDGTAVDSDKLGGIDSSNYTRSDLTNLGKYNTTPISLTSPEDWANLPVGWTGMIDSTVGVNHGAPINSAGFFTKISDDTNGGWSGLWITEGSLDYVYIGKVTTPSKYANWRSVHVMGVPLDNTVYFKQQEITGNGSININWNYGNYAKVLLTGNTTLAFSSPSGVCTLNLHVFQDNVGGHILTLPSGILWVNGDVPHLSTNANSKATIILQWDGNEYLGSYVEYQ